MGAKAIDRQSVIDELSREWTPEQIRDLAATLLRLADSLDQGWDGSNRASIFRWPSELARIERNGINLAMKARLISGLRARRRKDLDPRILGEPAWDMMLDLFMQFAGGARISATSLCIASYVPLSTGMHYITVLEEVGYVTRVPSELDKRITFVSLSQAGIVAMGRCLEAA